MAEHPDGPQEPGRQPYTIHADTDAATAATPEPASGTAGAVHGPDPLALVAGLATVVVAVLALTDSLTAVDGRWLLAGGAIVAGVIVLAAASRPWTRQDR